MIHPTFNKSASSSIKIPAVTGGVNLADPLNLVDDNQLTDMKNLWYKDGVLKTRPAMEYHKGIYDAFSSTMNGEGLKIKQTKFTSYVNGEEQKADVILDPNGNLTLLVYSKDSIQYRCTEKVAASSNISFVVFSGKPVVPKGLGVFLIITEGDLVSLYEAQKSEVMPYPLHRFTSDELYVPTVYVNGKMGSYANLPASQTEEYAPASFLEGYSCFSGAWASYCYTSDGVSNGLTLPVSFANSTLFVTYNSPDGKTKLTFGPVDIGEIIPDVILCNENHQLYEQYVILVNQYSGHISFRTINKDWTENPENSLQYPYFVPDSALGVYTNNIEVKIKPLNNKRTPLHGVQFGTWFGGTAEGISGGTRLFLSGSEEEKNLLVWSDLNNPTYFSENNYAYIGESNQRITALEKQSEMLVIFKENELFYTTYNSGQSYTAEDVKAGRVIDIATLSATFPIIQIHSKIGCNLPQTIQLCGDRLVWACKDKKVYMLKSANQYSTCNIAPISRNIDRALKTLSKEELSRANSCIYDGHYLLVFGSKVFVLNYDYYYFSSLPAYSDSKKSQRKLIWYLWELPELFDDANCLSWNFIFSGSECYISMFWARYFNLHLEIFRLNENYGEDITDFAKNTCPISTMLQTKVFDFGLPERFKKIEQLYIGFGEKTENVQISYVTDSGIADGGYIEINGEENEFSPEYIKTKRFLPGINRALRFGLRLSCECQIAVDGILIKVKTMGVTR